MAVVCKWSSTVAGTSAFMLTTAEELVPACIAELVVG